jgi:hypothetical protein
LIAAAAARLALFALIYQLVASHQHLNRIPGILRVDVGVGMRVGAYACAYAVAGASASVLAEGVTVR